MCDFSLRGQTLSSLAMNNQTNIEFESLRYGLKEGFINKNEKIILKDVSGEFRGRELSAIVGPSGSGKTSLLNILSGFVTRNVSGVIRINGCECRSESFKRRSTYIMQEENLHSLLTVAEAMNFAVRLKTGNLLSKKQQHEKIKKVLKTLGLEGKINDFSGDLSGGEQKRLSIALEIVDDPSILFLDEPTTGLDSSSSTQCIRLLKKLAQEGKTIVITIHSPSATVLGLFDQLYALADGSCIYQGASSNLVPFLSEFDLICPETFNPADFLLEIAVGAYGNQNSRLVKRINNGLNESYRRSANNNNDASDTMFNDGHKLPLDIRPHYSASFFAQFSQLMWRNILFLMRDKMLLWIRLAVHLVVGLMIGFIYFGIGNDASQIFNIFRFVAIAVGFLAYSGFYSLMVRLPLDLPITKREHFNRWYSTGAYYLALFISDVPVIITCCSLYLFLINVLTDQPMDFFRFSNFVFIGTLTSFTAQSFGMLIGSMFDIQASLSMAALLMATQVLFGGFFITNEDISSSMQWMFDATYLKHSLDGVGSLVFGFNRTKLNCHEIYCHFESPKKFMKFIGMHEDLSGAFVAIISTLVIVHTATFFIMRYRLRN